MFFKSEKKPPLIRGQDSSWRCWSWTKTLEKTKNSNCTLTALTTHSSVQLYIIIIYLFINKLIIVQSCECADLMCYWKKPRFNSCVQETREKGIFKSVRLLSSQIFVASNWISVVSSLVALLFIPSGICFMLLFHVHFQLHRSRVKSCNISWFCCWIIKAFYDFLDQPLHTGCTLRWVTTI